jgi:hypothetical protein
MPCNRLPVEIRVHHTLRRLRPASTSLLPLLRHIVVYSSVHRRLASLCGPLLGPTVTVPRIENSLRCTPIRQLAISRLSSPALGRIIRNPGFGLHVVVCPLPFLPLLQVFIFHLSSLGLVTKHIVRQTRFQIQMLSYSPNSISPFCWIQ